MDIEPTSARRSLMEEVEANPAAAREMAAARLALRIQEDLRSALADSGMNQADLADELGVSESAVSQVLNGDGNLRIYTLARYLRALGVEMATSVVPAGGTHLGRGRRRRANLPGAPLTVDARPAGKSKSSAARTGRDLPDNRDDIAWNDLTWKSANSTANSSPRDSVSR